MPVNPETFVSISHLLSYTSHGFHSFISQFKPHAVQPQQPLTMVM
jgi:hypothetical protein